MLPCFRYWMDIQKEGIALRTSRSPSQTRNRWCDGVVGVFFLLLSEQNHSLYSHAISNVSWNSERGRVSSVPMPLKIWKGSHVLVRGLSIFAFLSPINYKHLFYGTWKDYCLSQITRVLPASHQNTEWWSIWDRNLTLSSLRCVKQRGKKERERKCTAV
jgi:hypothetical protein